jgi:hypothetical protein
MKKQINPLIGLLCLFIFTTCDKDVEIISSFDYIISMNYRDKATVNLPENMSFSVVPERFVNTQSYQFKYESKDGLGYFVLDGSILAQREWIPLKELTLSLDFMATTIGSKEIEVTFSDADGLEKTETLRFLVEHNPFIWNASTTTNTININEEVPISLLLTNTGFDKNATYERNIYFIQGSGNINLINEEEESELLIETGKFAEMLPGSFSLIGEFKETGINKLIFEARDQNGQTQKDTLSITVEEIEFSFTASPQKNEIDLGENTNLNFNITESNPSGTSYQMRYEIVSGSGTITSGGETVAPNTFTPVPTGNFSWDFESSTPGSIEMIFYVRNETGVESQRAITLVVSERDYDLTVTPAAIEAFVGSSINITLLINELGATGDTYTGFYSSSGTGSMEIAGQDYTAGQQFALIKETNALTYTGVSEGRHTLTFKVKSTSNIEKEISTEIDFVSIDFNFSGSASNNELFITETTNLNFIINQTGIGATTYESRYIINQGEGLIRGSNGIQLAPNTYYETSEGPGNYTWNFEATKAGRVDITFFTRNVTGQEEEIRLFIDVEATDFSLDIVAANTNDFVFQTIPLSFTLNQQGVEQLTYNMTYSSNGDGVLTIEGVDYNPGENIALTSVPGTFNGSYTGNSVGNHQVTFRVVSSNNITEDKTININFNTIGFQISVPANLSIKETLTESFNVVINPDRTDLNVNYEIQLVTDQNGTFNFGGISPGIYLPASTGNNTFNYTPMDYANGTHIITVSVRDNLGNTNVENIVVNVNRKPVAFGRAEKENVNCGGLNGCDYRVRMYIKRAGFGESQAFDGATITTVRLRIYNRQDNRWVTIVRNFNEMETNTQGDIYWRLEEEARESRLRYLDQDFEIEVQDSDGIWSDKSFGSVIRV